MKTSQFDDATQALQNGDEAQAHNLLRQVMQQSQTDQEAWLLLAELAEQPSQKIFCLNQALLLDPENSKARLWLDELQSQVNQAAEPEPPEATPAQPEPSAARPPAAVWQDKVCPFLGLEQDRQSFTSYPSAINFCYRLTPAKPINQPYQASHCLNENHRSCKLLQNRPDTRPQPEPQKKD
jgi:hypothetical protein